VVILTGLLLFAYLYTNTGKKEVEGYDIYATFNATDGLRDGAAVRLSGVKVGTVAGYELDARFRSKVTLRLASGTLLPSDSAALIHTDGLLGEKYIELQPGGEDKFLKPGGTISFTQDSIIIVDLMEKIVEKAKARRGITDSNKK
jgi:phospholipid/cholesterol/gamma-HCH transport system substrate-binding protein